MASLTVPIRPPRDTSGEEFSQKTLTSTTLASGTALVPAVADKVGVIDYLVIKTTSALAWKITSGTGSDTIVDETTSIANTPETLWGPIRANAANLALTLTVASGTVVVFCRYHNERSSSTSA